MKLTPTYFPDDELLSLKLDSEAQVSFAKTALILEDFYNDPDVRTLAAHSSDLLDKMAAAIHVMMELGSANSGQITLQVDNLGITLEVAIQVANYRAQRRLPVGTLPQALWLLAMGMPCFLPHLAIPPAAEVLNQKAVPETTWKGYEAIRFWPDGIDPYLYLSDGYQIWRALDAEPPSHPELQKLLRSTDAATRLFRVTMARLAIVEMASRKKRPNRRRRKP